MRHWEASEEAHPQFGRRQRGVGRAHSAAMVKGSRDEERRSELGSRNIEKWWIFEIGRSVVD